MRSESWNQWQGSQMKQAFQQVAERLEMGHWHRGLASTSLNRSEQHQCRLFEQFFDFRQELGTDSTVDHAVVT